MAQQIPEGKTPTTRGPEEWAALEARVKEAERRAEFEEKNSEIQWRDLEKVRLKLQEVETARIKEAIQVLSRFSDQHSELLQIIWRQENTIADLEATLARERNK